MNHDIVITVMPTGLRITERSNCGRVIRMFPGVFNLDSVKAYVGERIDAALTAQDDTPRTPEDRIR